MRVYVLVCTVDLSRRAGNNIMRNWNKKSGNQEMKKTERCEQKEKNIRLKKGKKRG